MFFREFNFSCSTALISVMTRLGDCVLSRTSLLCSSNRFVSPSDCFSVQKPLCVAISVFTLRHRNLRIARALARARLRFSVPEVRVLNSPFSICVQFLAAASTRQCTSDDLWNLVSISEEMEPVVNWQQKGFRGCQAYHSLQAQVKRSLSPLLKLEQVSWVSRVTGQHCVHLRCGLACSICVQR